MYLPGDWQVIMFYWSRNISGLIYSFTHLDKSGGGQGRE